MNREYLFIKKFEPLWNKWYVDQFIGKGNYGSVYKISREDWGYKQTSAVKVLRILPNMNDIRDFSIEKLDENSIKSHYYDIVKNIIEEIKILYKLRQYSNIVSYEDHMIIEGEKEFEWYIFIRMEFLTSFSNYIIKNPLTVNDVINVGLHMCSALEACKVHNIIHRDIKEENIFLTDEKIYKLGDFGIAKDFLNSENLTTSKGTPYYMAPEVFNNNLYDERVDIYSLGIVLYKLLNHGRIPFLPQYPEKFTGKDRKKAFELRILGKIMIPPSFGNEKLKSIVLKACSYNYQNRYKSAIEMREELMDCFVSLTEEEKNTVINQYLLNDSGKENDTSIDTEYKSTDFMNFDSKKDQLENENQIQNNKEVSNVNNKSKIFLFNVNKKVFLHIGASILVVFIFIFVTWYINSLYENSNFFNNSETMHSDIKKNSYKENEEVYDSNNKRNSDFVDNIDVNQEVSTKDYETVVPSNMDTPSSTENNNTSTPALEPLNNSITGTWSGKMQNKSTLLYRNISISLTKSANKVNATFNEYDDYLNMNISYTGEGVIEDNLLRINTKYTNDDILIIYKWNLEYIETGILNLSCSRKQNTPENMEKIEYTGQLTK